MLRLADEVLEIILRPLEKPYPNRNANGYENNKEQELKHADFGSGDFHPRAGSQVSDASWREKLSGLPIPGDSTHSPSLI